MRFLTILLSSLSFVFTVLPFIRSPIWWIRIFDFPRVQIAFLCLVSLVMLFIYFGYKKFSNRILISLVAGALLYQVSLIIKFTPLYPVHAPAATSKQDAFSVMQVNVEMSNRQTQKLKELILRHQPDIISINEPNEWWANELKVFDRLYPYSIKKPQSNTYGMILLSKFPLKNKEINFLVDNDIPSFSWI